MEKIEVSRKTLRSNSLFYETASGKVSDFNQKIERTNCVSVMLIWHVVKWEDGG